MIWGENPPFKETTILKGAGQHGSPPTLLKIHLEFDAKIIDSLIPLDKPSQHR